MTLAKFRSADLFFFSVLAIVTQYLSTAIFTDHGAGFRISFGLLIFVIASIRWGYKAVIVYICVGLIEMYRNPMNNVLYNIILYIVGNAFAALPIYFYGKRDRNKLVSNIGVMCLYAFLVLLSLSIGKGVAILIIEGDALGFLSFFASMLLTFVISLILMIAFCARKTELMVDMEKYLESQVGSEE